MENKGHKGQESYVKRENHELSSFFKIRIKSVIWVHLPEALVERSVGLGELCVMVRRRVGRG